MVGNCHITGASILPPKSNVRAFFPMQLNFSLNPSIRRKYRNGALTITCDEETTIDIRPHSIQTKVRELKPDVPRIILTGYADKENAIKAINEVGLFQYIEKPWDNEDILIVLRNGLERQLLMKKLEEKITEINKAYGELQNLQKEIVKTFV